MTRHLFALLLALFLLTPAAALAETSTTAVTAGIIEHGIFGGVLERGPMQDGSDSMGSISQPRLVKQTDTVPARPETLFGIRYRVSAPEGVESVLLEIRVEHPPLPAEAQAEPLTSYSVERLVKPDEAYVQLQRVPPDAPEHAPAGEWRFVLLFQGKELASQRLELVRADSGFALLQGEPERQCRQTVLQTPPEALGREVAEARLLEEHTFALRLPDIATEEGRACFLTLGNDQGSALAISRMDGRLLSPVQPWEAGLRVLAVSFSEVGGDAYPEVVVVAENAAQTPPVPDSRVYFHIPADERDKGAEWRRLPEVDSQVAHLGSAFAVRQWLAANAPVVR